MNMKKTMLSLSLVLGLSITAFAQNVKYGVKAGLTFPKIAASGNQVDELPDNAKANPSFFFGGYADIAVSSQFSVQPGISLIGKGSKFEETESGVEEGIAYSGTAKFTLSTMYVEIPVNLVGKVPAGPGDLFFGAGPYLGYAVSGKSKTKVSLNIGGNQMSESEEEDVEFGSNEDQMKRIEYGVNFLGGYQLKNGLNFNVGYGLGLSNLANNSGDGKISNRLFCVGVGFSY